MSPSRAADGAPTRLGQALRCPHATHRLSPGLNPAQEAPSNLGEGVGALCCSVRTRGEDHTWRRGPARDLQRPLPRGRPGSPRRGGGGNPLSAWVSGPPPRHWSRPECPCPAPPTPHPARLSVSAAAQGPQLCVPTWPAHTGTHSRAWPLERESGHLQAWQAPRVGRLMERSLKTEAWGFRGRADFAGWLPAVGRGAAAEARAEGPDGGLCPSPQRIRTRKGTERLRCQAADTLFGPFPKGAPRTAVPLLSVRCPFGVGFVCF